MCLVSYRPDLQITFTNDFYVGVACALGAATLWSLSGVYVKYILNKKTDPLALSFVRIAMGSIFALAITILFIQDPFASLSFLNVKDWSLILYIGIFLSGFAYLFFYRSLNILDAHVAILLIGLSIVVLVLFGLLIGETISPIQWLGIALIGVSILLVKKPAPVD